MKTNLGLFLDFIKSREFVSSANVFEAIVAKNKIITRKKTHTQCLGFFFMFNGILVLCVELLHGVVNAAVALKLISGGLLNQIQPDASFRAKYVRLAISPERNKGQIMYDYSAMIMYIYIFHSCCALKSLRSVLVRFFSIPHFSSVLFGFFSLSKEDLCKHSYINIYSVSQIGQRVKKNLTNQLARKQRQANIIKNNINKKRIGSEQCALCALCSLSIEIHLNPWPK